MQWEYLIETHEASTEDGTWNLEAAKDCLNKYGREGWELVGVWGYPFILFLKRPVSVELTCSVEMTEDRTAELAEKIAHELDRYMLGNR